MGTTQGNQRAIANAQRRANFRANVRSYRRYSEKETATNQNIFVDKGEVEGVKKALQIFKLSDQYKNDLQFRRRLDMLENFVFPLNMPEKMNSQGYWMYVFPPQRWEGYQKIVSYILDIPVEKTEENKQSSTPDPGYPEEGSSSIPLAGIEENKQLSIPDPGYPEEGSPSAP